MAFLTSREYATFRIYRYERSGYYAETSGEIAYADDKQGLKVVVPKGFKTDFASVPKIFHCVLSPIDKWAQASVIHDYLYAKGSYATSINAGVALKTSRAQADRVFYNAMLDSSTNKFTAWLMWAMVRAFGKFSYKKRDA